MDTPTLPEELTIGKIYRVPCVYWISKGKWMPILGPKHEDREHVKFEPVHYHIDWRFISDSILRATNFSRHEWKIFGIVISDHSSEQKLRMDTIKILKRTCHRSMPEYPPVKNVTWQKDLEKAYAGKKLCHKICPHRGLDLTGLKPNANGQIVCPGHGLAFSATSGELTPRI